MRTVNLVLAMFVCACSGSGNGSNDAADGMDALDAGDGDQEPKGGQVAWAVRAGGPQYDFAAGIDAAEDGWSVIAGGFQESIVFGPGEPNQTELTSAGDWDAYLARYQPDGTLVWARGIGSALYDRAWSVSVASDGSAVAAGSFPDAVVVKYDRDGTLLWPRGAESQQNIWGRGVSALADGGCVTMGWLAGTATFGPGEVNQTELTSDGRGDVFLARYDPDGALVWATRAGGPEDDEGRGITTDSDGSSVAIGRFQGTATFGPGEPNQTAFTSAGGFDLFLARYRQDGTLDWARHIGGASHEEPGSVSMAPDGSVLVTASFQGTVVLGPGTPDQVELTTGGAWDVLVARYGRDGTLAWVKTITGASSEHGHVISALPDGSALVAGWIKGAATFGTGEAGQTLVRPVGATDMFVARYHPDGTFAWVRHAGGTGNVSARGLSALEDGSALAMGAFSDTAVFGSGEINETALTSVGEHDLFVVRLEP